MAESMNIGIVVSFYGAKGYGFIKPVEGEEDLFVHHSEIQSDGYRTLREGQKVKFLVADKDGRKKAVTVTPVDKLNVEKNSKCNGNSNRGRGGRLRSAKDNRNGNVYAKDGGVDGRECYNCGGIGHFYRDCISAVTNSGSSGAGDRVCFNCGVLGHIARNCDRGGRSNGGGGGECFNCGVVGHMARDCTLDDGGNHGRKINGGGECYNCGVLGHMARDCSSTSGGGSKRSGGGDSSCYNCGEPGHFARECPSNA